MTAERSRGAVPARGAEQRQAAGGHGARAGDVARSPRTKVGGDDHGRDAGATANASGGPAAGGRDAGATASASGGPAAGDGRDAGRDRAAVGRFVERFASVLAEAGIPRMPARVFAALFATDSGRLTAAELSEQLQASPAAVSGGVRYLMGVGMVTREGEPGSRRHHYRIPDSVWDEVVTGRDRLMARWTSVLREGIEVIGRDTPAGARLADSVQYFEFVIAELPRVLARWQEHKAASERGADAQS